ncbi:MAG: hypothetical protein K8F25_13215 [Fimbriimonadaceae bacterium]|nr:hypothetical protein [Alphaproteobacteria bacterium]
MEKAKTSISRRTMFSSALAAGVALTIPVAALAQAEALTDNDASALLLQKHLAALGTALVNGQIDVKWATSKTGHKAKSVFTIRLDRIEGAEFMGSIFAGTIFAGHIGADELIAKLENGIRPKSA